MLTYFPCRINTYSLRIIPCIVGEIWTQTSTHMQVIQAENVGHSDLFSPGCWPTTHGASTHQVWWSYHVQLLSKDAISQDTILALYTLENSAQRSRIPISGLTHRERDFWIARASVLTSLWQSHSFCVRLAHFRNRIQSNSFDLWQFWQIWRICLF